MSDSLDRSTNINLLKEPVVKKLCEVLDKSSSKGWRKFGEIVSSDRRFKVRWVQNDPHYNLYTVIVLLLQLRLLTLLRYMIVPAVVVVVLVVVVVVLVQVNSVMHT